MSKEAEIKKIVLDLSGKEVSLTTEQAKKLHELLDELFGKETIYIPGPIVIERDHWWWHPTQPMWTCSNSSGTEVRYASGTLSASL